MHLTKSQLDAALTSLANANCRANAARTKIMNHAQAVYGVAPGDVDNDEFIDSCDNGCGNPGGVSAEDFDKSMLRSMAQMGVQMPTKQCERATRSSPRLAVQLSNVIAVESEC